MLCSICGGPLMSNRKRKMNNRRIPVLQMTFTKAAWKECKRETLCSIFNILRLSLVQDWTIEQDSLLTFIISFWWAGGANASMSLLVMRRGACILFECKCSVEVRRGIEDMAKFKLWFSKQVDLRSSSALNSVDELNYGIPALRSFPSTFLHTKPRILA